MNEFVLPGLVQRRALLAGELDAASGAVRKTVEASVGRALRHQRAIGVVRNEGKAGRVMLWGLVE